MLITLPIFAMTVLPILFDWNRTHVFNPAWPPHAGFHNALEISMAFGYSLVALWLLWMRSAEPGAGVLTATLVSVIFWGSFFIAISVPGTLGEEGIPRILNIPLNLFIAALMLLVTVLGFGLCRRGLRNPIQP